MDQQAKDERGQDTQPEAGGHSAGAGPAVRSWRLLTQQLPVLSFSREVGVLLGLE